MSATGQGRRRARAARRRHDGRHIRAVLRMCGALVLVAVAAACGGGSDGPVDGDADRGAEGTTVSGTATDASLGGCQDQVDSAAAEAGHEDPGTDMRYDGVPPASGVHWAEWQDLSAGAIYAADERPDLGELVHSHEHGWTMVWYDETIADDDAAMAELQAAADAVAAAGVPKVAFMPWTSDDGDAFPDDTHVALTHWGGGDDETERRQFCATVHPDAVLAFAERNPYTDSREPNAP